MRSHGAIANTANRLTERRTMERPDPNADAETLTASAHRYAAQLRSLNLAELVTELDDIGLSVATVQDSPFGRLAVLKLGGRDLSLVGQLAQDEFKRRAFTFGSGIAMQLDEKTDPEEIRPADHESHAPEAARLVAKLEEEQAAARAARAAAETPLVPPPLPDAHEATRAEPDGSDILHDETH